jgi:UDP-3-O-[3-hydroxymyristoyl] glucosamine N-acyltransferase
VILGHVTVGADVQIGCDGMIHPGVRIADGMKLGDRVIVHANAVIGADGFSFTQGERDEQPTAAAGARPLRIHSLGTVTIEDDVEIGAGTTIDRATISATRIGRGTKIDNVVQIAHNVRIGEDCLICAKTGISGSVTVGDRVQIAGGVGIADHVKIGSDAVIAAGSGVASNVSAGTFVSGYPAMKHERTLEALVYLGRQKALHAKVGDLQLRIKELEKLIKREP